jgi:hypothetical protein
MLQYLDSAISSDTHFLMRKVQRAQQGRANTKVIFFRWVSCKVSLRYYLYTGHGGFPARSLWFQDMPWAA